MLSTDTGIFIRFPSQSDERTLHPATIVEVHAGGYTAELEEPLQIEPNQEVSVYFERRREFMQQPARIDAVIPGDDCVAVGFALTGEPVSAESRQCYRVTTVSDDLTAIIDDYDQCQILDISATGFSISSVHSYNIGAKVNVVLNYEDQDFQGTATIQSVTELSKSEFRYGLYCADEKDSLNNLRSALERISAAVQRKQLRRMAGNA